MTDNVEGPDLTDYNRHGPLVEKPSLISANRTADQQDRDMGLACEYPNHGQPPCRELFEVGDDIHFFPGYAGQWCGKCDRSPSYENNG